MLRLLVDRRRRIGADHTRMVCQLHAAAAGTDSWWRKAGPVRAQARKLLAGVVLRTWSGQTRKRVALELVVDLERAYARKKAANKELVALVRHRHRADSACTASALPAPPGCSSRSATSPASPTKGHFASWTGTAPIDASSGDNVRQRLSRGGNRQSTRSYTSWPPSSCATRTTKGRAYYDRKVAAGKTPNEAMRCLKRRLSDMVLPHHDRRPRHRRRTGPGGHRGASLTSSAAGSHPHTGTSDSHFPDPPPPSLEPPCATAS